MDQLQQLGKQFRQLLPVLILFVVAFSVIPGCAQPKVVVHDLTEQEANEIIVFLARRGITAEKATAVGGRSGGGNAGPTYNLTVKTDDYEKSLALLNVHGLPRRRGTNLLHLFSQGGLVPSPLEEQVKYQEGLSEKIAGTILQIDGVLDARVQLSFPEEDSLNPGAIKKEKSASVYVKHQGVLDDPNSQLITKIKRLVASSIEGLKFENVTVIADRARFTGDPDSLAADLAKEPNYVKIWGIIIGADSVTRFRVLFVSMCVFMLVSLLAVLWLGYKVFPILSRTGGFSQLLTLRPIAADQLTATTADEEKEDASEDEESSDEESDDDDDELDEEERPEA